MRGARIARDHRDERNSHNHSLGRDLSAYDLISRRAMLEGLQAVDEAVVPFVSIYSSRSGYFLEDAEGTTHTIVQREGGEHGDPMVLL